MAYSGTQYGDISPRIGIVAVADMLAYAKSKLVLEKFGKVYSIPKNKGLILRFRRPVPFAVADTTLTEGVTPAPQTLEYEDVETSIAQYGAWVAFTDVIQDVHEDPNLKIMSELCGKQAGDTKEAILWGVLRAGTAVIYSGTATSRATVGAPLAYEDIAGAIREMKANHADKITKVLGAGTGIATEPVQAAYVLVGHTDTEFDWRSMDTFISAEKYASGKVIDENEIGSVGQVRIILTPHLEPFFGAGLATASAPGVLANTNGFVDVYASVLLAQDCFAVTPLAGMNSATMAVTNPKMGTPGDELGQRGSVAWKMWYAAKILNDNWMIRFEHAVTAL